MAISQSDIDALDAQIVNATKTKTVRFEDQELHTEQVSLEELINRRAIALQLLNANKNQSRSSFVAFSKPGPR